MTQIVHFVCTISSVAAIIGEALGLTVCLYTNQNILEVELLLNMGDMSASSNRSLEFNKTFLAMLRQAVLNSEIFFYHTLVTDKGVIKSLQSWMSVKAFRAIHSHGDISLKNGTRQKVRDHQRQRDPLGTTFVCAGICASLSSICCIFPHWKLSTTVRNHQKSQGITKCHPRIAEVLQSIIKVTATELSLW